MAIGPARGRAAPTREAAPARPPGRWASLALVALLLCAAAVPVRAATETLLVLGLHNDLPPSKKYRDWRDFRLGLGIRGRLTQLAADTGAFVLLEDRTLAASLREALGGYWIEESALARDPEAARRESGAAWVLYGDLDHVGVTRNRLSGPIGRASWKYRVRLSVCLHGDAARELCQAGEGESRTAKTAIGFAYRGDDLAWDQAGPSEAVGRALDAAFADLWRRVAGRLPQRHSPLAAAKRPWSGEPLPVYVAGFGLSATVERLYPELAESRVGWGLCQRIVESLYDSGRFTFVEEKAEVVHRMARLLRDPSADEVPTQAAEWLLYGEVVDLQVARREKIRRGGAELETRITLQIRWVERRSQHVFPATGSGSHVARLVDWKAGRPIDDLDERSIGIATDVAVAQAVERLLQSLAGSGTR